MEMNLAKKKKKKHLLCSQFFRIHSLFNWLFLRKKTRYADMYLYLSAHTFRKILILLFKIGVCVCTGYRRKM